MGAAAETDMLDAVAGCHAMLGDVLSAAGNAGGAAGAYERALEGYERKGNIVSAERMRAKRAELAGTA